MSTAARIISGSLASWAQIFVTLISQVLLVPIFLTFWKVEIYGIWIAIQTLLNVISMIDFGHQEYLGYEFLRFGREKKFELVKYLWSGVIMNVLIGLFQIAVIVILMFSGLLPVVLGKSEVFNAALLHTAGTILLCQAFSYVVLTSMPSLFFRALVPFGYFPRLAWWNFFSSVITSFTPVVAVLCGADLLITGITTALASIIFSLPIYLDVYKLSRKENIFFDRPSVPLGYKNFLHSLMLSGKALLENLKHQGVRLIITPLVGPVSLVAFSTMRTGANVALQGLNTIVNPLMPELMRFLHQRDQTRITSAFGTVWFILVVILAPGVVMLQVIVEPLYTIWVKGKIAFNPLLFSTLSLTVLVYAAIQPAIAIVRGNNMLKAQLRISILASVTLLAGVFILIPLTGILGAGIGLLAAELIATVSYKRVAEKWLVENNLQWPKKIFAIVCISVLTAAIGMFLIIAFPAFNWILLLITLAVHILLILQFWKLLPAVAVENVKRILNKFNIIKKYLYLPKG